MNIAITGVGGGVGQNIIKSLKDSDYNIVALDADSLATGLYMSKTAYLIPFANQDSYIPRLLEICEKENISILFPGSDPELMPLSLNSHLFEKIGTQVVVSKPDVIRITQDIQQAFGYLSRFGVNVPVTFLAETYKPLKDDFPFILRQRVGGARSMNKFLIRNTREWENTLKKI